MARYRGPVYRLCRREGLELGLKGTKAESGKSPLDKRPFPPGDHGQRRTKLSNYGLQLREKQKVKRMYGLLEKQFRKYFHEAARRRGVTGHVLIELLERRLDNVVYRMGIATSRPEARQMVSHRGIVVNDKRVNIPSFQVRSGDVVEAAPNRKGQRARMTANLDRTVQRPIPEWLDMDKEQLKGTIVRIPQRDDIGLPIEEQLIVELYSK